MLPVQNLASACQTSLFFLLWPGLAPQEPSPLQFWGKSEGGQMASVRDCLSTILTVKALTSLRNLCLAWVGMAVCRQDVRFSQGMAQGSVGKGVFLGRNSAPWHLTGSQPPDSDLLGSPGPP